MFKFRNLFGAKDEPKTVPVSNWKPMLSPAPPVVESKSISVTTPIQSITKDTVSFISVIEGDAKTFAAWAEKELGKLSTEAPAIAKVVDTITQYVGGTAAVLAGLEGGPAASAAVNSAVNAVQSGVTAVSGLVTDFGATPTVASIATSLQTNATALLTAAKITNPASVTASTAIINNLAALATALTTSSKG